MQEAESQIKELQAGGKKNQPKVVEDLLKAVFDVELVPPTAA
jgi:V-type H+-transporting ATPase subunit G